MNRNDGKSVKHLDKHFKIKSLPDTNGSFAVEKQEVHEFILQFNGEDVMHCRHFRGVFEEYMEFDADIFVERNLYFGTGMDDRTMGDFGMTTSKNGLGNSCPTMAKVRMGSSNKWQFDMGFNSVSFEEDFLAKPFIHQVAIHVFNQFVRVNHTWKDDRRENIDLLATDYLLGGNA